MFVNKYYNILHIYILRFYASVWPSTPLHLHRSFMPKADPGAIRVSQGKCFDKHWQHFDWETHRYSNVYGERNEKIKVILQQFLFPIVTKSIVSEAVINYSKCLRTMSNQEKIGSDPPCC